MQASRDRQPRPAASRRGRASACGALLWLAAAMAAAAEPAAGADPPPAAETTRPAAEATRPAAEATRPAAEATRPAAETTRPAEGPDASPSPPRRLTLTEAIAQALESNFGIRLARHELASTQSSLIAEQNVFDFKLRTRLATQDAFQRNLLVTTPGGALINRDVLTDTQRLSLGLEREVKWGGRFAVETGLARARSRFEAIDPTHEADLTVRYEQPLWRGSGRAVATAGLVFAESALRQQSRSLEEDEMSLVVEVTRAFHQVTRLESVLQIDREAAGRAMENLLTYRVRLEEGLITPIDVARAESEQRERESVVVLDEERLRSSRDQLAFLLGLPVATDLGLEEARPSLDPLRLDLQAAVSEALAQRVSVQNQREAVALAELQARVARSNTKPRVDLGFAVSASTIVGDEPSSFWKLDDDDDWRAGFDLEYTFRERADDEAYVRARIAEEQARVTLERVERGVELEVRNSVREVQALERTVELLGKNLEFTRESLRLAQLQLQEDLIRTTDLLQIQSSVVRAEIAHANALEDHAVALVNLDLVLGRYRTDAMTRRSSFLREAPLPGTASEEKP